MPDFSNVRTVFIAGFAAGMIFTYVSVLLSRSLQRRADQAKRNDE